jgi:Fur family transcriptional regulator, iron response regulator
MKAQNAPDFERLGLAERLQAHGVRPTAQRLKIASLLLVRPQHLSAEQILGALKSQGLRVSKATVYNTLNLFAAHGLVRQLSVGEDRAVFDSVTEPHYHMHDLESGALTDVPSATVRFSALPEPPPGTEIVGIDLTIQLRRRPVT